MRYTWLVGFGACMLFASCESCTLKFSLDVALGKQVPPPIVVQSDEYPQPLVPSPDLGPPLHDPDDEGNEDSHKNYGVEPPLLKRTQHGKLNI